MVKKKKKTDVSCSGCIDTYTAQRAGLTVGARHDVRLGKTNVSMEVQEL